MAPTRNLLKSSTRRISKLRKYENEKIDEMNELNKRRSGRTPLIEKLCSSLEESTDLCNSQPSSAMSEAEKVLFCNIFAIF